MPSARAIRPPALDLALAGVLLGAALTETIVRTPGATPWALSGTVVVSGSLVLRRVAPLAMALAAAGAVLLLPRVGGVVWLLAAVLLIAFSVGLHLSPARAALGLTALFASAVLPQSRTASLPEALLTPLVLIGGAGAVGAVLAATRRQGRRLAALADRLREERDAQQRMAVDAERSRVSRDLHDILAHTLSTIVVQASAAVELLGPEAPGHTSMAAAAEAGRAALGEARSLIALARSAPPPAPAEDVAPARAHARPWEWATAAGFAVVGAGLVVLSRTQPGGLPDAAFGIALLLSFAPPALLSARPAIAGLAAVTVASFLYPNDQPTAIGAVLSVVVLVGAPAVAGFLVGRARSRAVALRRLTTRLAAERERSAAMVAAAERTRIARELHDVLAHTLSSIAVQAGAAQQLVPAAHPARGPVDAVAASARDALTEVRGLLADDDGEPAPVVPGPSLDRVPELIAADGAPRRPSR